MDLLRLIYRNFIKCFWNEYLCYSTSLSTTFDWYFPLNTKRFSKEEVENNVNNCYFKLKHFNQEKASFSGGILKTNNI